MADPLLTSLCAICHIEVPKYKCPGCLIRTCSIACQKRHKVRSSCNGIRDPTAYLPPSKLKTPAGVDHDYNFLSGIERAVQRSEKEIVEERQILKPEDLRPIEVRTVKWKTGKDGRKRRVLVTELLHGDGAGGAGAKGDMLSSMPFKRRLAKFGILLKRAPFGMARQKENSTNVSKASGRINWQVEWRLLQAPTPDAQRAEMEQQQQQQQPCKETATTPKSQRILAKTLDDVPLYKAFASGLKWHHDDLARREKLRPRPDQDQDEHDANAAGKPKKRRKHAHKPGQSTATAQDTETGAWHPGRYCQQNGPRGTWTPHTGVPAFTGTTEEDESQRTRYSYYLVGTTSAAAAMAGRTAIHPIEADVALCEAIRDMTVLEFPTIYVVESGALLPSSLVSEPKPVRITPKRKREDQSVGGGGGKGPKKKRQRRPMEDGELPSDVDEDSDDGQGDEEGRLEALQNIIAEESLGEEDDDSTTSSSGSDSDGDDDDVRASLAAKLALLERRRPRGAVA
ncbi:putative box C/D snoRNA protein [Colletotrichum spinosum]|uniref:Box C/D snoRNA protein 1 n=1 Tax=Colletotrichum spinosum TaxID=1347390 RepID=A0A4R8QCQ0_9PEZI|nr:putative box C/D snoRNA protein [Colletotrichum spinosum]